ncbi:hypothetical protein INH39_02075 [Massilia violaceinigra]|uniref:RiboL-PSP-HEPN domain-containing protein n=1 Tax=Massilia violaceinigra TaxID=2045208 RepID=A0ABY4A6Z9_9BURK|nr:HEPN domain-containing protein [Massilia violaceinigra]UOD30561.1 hypothetical protein INH39_02075 [Massilia violaceinigra]
MLLNSFLEVISKMKEWTAKIVFDSYLNEVFETCNGIFLAKEARGTLLKYLSRETLAHDVVAQGLINTALSAVPKIRDGHVVRSLYMSAHAGFEQYLRSLFEAAALSISNAKLHRSKLSVEDMDRVAILDALRGWQISLAGDAFGRYFEPLAHLSVDYSQVADAIVQCGDEKAAFVIDGKVFGFRVGNVDRKTIDKLFTRFRCELQWSKLANNPEVQKLLDTKSKAETDKEITNTLLDALKNRNRIAHTQGEFDISKEELLKHIKFLEYFSEFLFNALSEHVTKLLK